jgi:ribosomal protein L11 methylase PrmA
LSAAAAADFESLERTRFYRQFQDQGRLVETRRLDEQAARPLLPALGGGPWQALLEHRRVAVVSYPYEWSFSMLREAALLTLDLQLAALNEGLTLKDASAYNVQFEGVRPVFIDLGSFARLEPGAPWAGYLQFCQHFLYPLLLQAHKGIDFQPFLRGRLDGILPETMAPLFRGFERLRAGVLTHVWLQARLRKSAQDAGAGLRSELRRAGFSPELVIANVRGLRRLVERLEWRPSASAWVDYAATHSYSAGDHAQKRAFVERVAAARRWGTVWDLGSNTGTFSRLVAPHAEVVLALDADHATVDRLARELRGESSPPPVLPLVQDLADPSPGLGWRGRERGRLEDRARPDLILGLALIHHLALSANLPLAEVLDEFAALGCEAVLEWVDRADPMVERLLRHKSERHEDYDLSRFEAEIVARFAVRSRAELPSGGRILYHLAPR